MTILSLTSVVVGYDAEPVLRGVSLDVPEGSLVAIVGPSGCGKTTLLRTIAGLVRARSGEIRLGRRMVATHGIHLAPEKRRIGWVPQDAALFPHLTVAENVAFGLGTGKKAAIGGVRGAARKQARSERVRHLLALVDLTALADRLPAQLSGGQSQRVALARALAGVPDVVLLDEPFGALDPLLRGDLRDEVRALLRVEGMTGILVTHDQAEALSVADYVAVMRLGEILQFGRPDEVYRRPATPWVASFVGEAVFLPGVWTPDAPEGTGGTGGTGGTARPPRTGTVHCALGRLPAEWV
ncbi:ABC transporter ATP-binding protein, partial [Cryobacterium sp. TMT1-2-1]